MNADINYALEKLKSAFGRLDVAVDRAVDGLDRDGVFSDLNLLLSCSGKPLRYSWSMKGLVAVKIHARVLKRAQGEVS